MLYFASATCRRICFPPNSISSRCLGYPSSRFPRAPLSQALSRHYATQEGTKEPKTLRKDAKQRVNQIHVQQLSDVVYKQVFPGLSSAIPEVPTELIQLSTSHLKHHELYGKNSDNTPPIGFDLPELVGDSKTLDEHFHWLGMSVAQPYLQLAKDFANGSIPEAPYTEPPIPAKEVENGQLKPPEETENGHPKPPEEEEEGNNMGSKFPEQAEDGGEMPNEETIMEKRSPKAPGRMEWVLDRPGWTKYVVGQVPEPVDSPGNEEMLVFDVETLYKESPFAIMACAASPTAWYSWLSPWLLEQEGFSNRQLIPLGDPTKPRVVVGHNIGYDRARVKEEYDLKPTRNAFLDTMSLHVAVNGMCSRQRPTWLKHKKNMEIRAKLGEETDSVALRDFIQQTSGGEEEELWLGRSSINSLKDVAEFHCNIKVDKMVRDQFGVLDRKGVRDMLPTLLNYCASDVSTTFEVYQQVLDGFLSVCPHPVSFGALRHLSSVILPVNQGWEDYIIRAEGKYKELSEGVEGKLLDLVKAVVEKSPEEIKGNHWLEQLDWTVEPQRYLKPKKLKKPKKQEKPEKPEKPKKRKKKSKKQDGALVEGSPEAEAQPAAEIPQSVEEEIILIPDSRQKLPGKPQWYRDLVKKQGAPPTITVRSRIAAIMLGLSWDTYPLVWSDKHGWTFKVPAGEADAYMEKEKNAIKCVFSDEDKPAHLKEDKEHVYFKLPHKDGPLARCVNPLSKAYLKLFEEGRLTSDLPLAREALDMNAQCSYWISSRERILGQMMVYQDELSKMGIKQEDDPEKARLEAVKEDSLAKPDVRLRPSAAPPTSNTSDPKLGFILPQLIPMGTITRRAVEKTWLTASNAKKNRVGSELKSMVTAPSGYHFVGADVDSQELWIASLVGDAQLQLHGGTALGFMTLEGTKSAGTDLHSKTASILGISRNSAKIFNYGRIYGAGVKFATALLKQFNPSISDVGAVKTAEDLYKATKGEKLRGRHTKLVENPFWFGGTESFVFNRLEDFANQEKPRTPVLGAGITEALMKQYLSKGGFMTSRINWAIQSSGVDYLHLLVTSMDYLIRKYGLDARLAITVHDEIRYLVKSEDRYRAVMALQIANVWTRAMFSQQMGINDLPQSCAYFSAVDIDTVLRKEVDMDCITPSNPNPIPPGESVDIFQLLDKGEEARLDRVVNPAVDIEIEESKEMNPYVARVPVMRELADQSGTKSDQLWALKAQMATNISAAIGVMKAWRAERDAFKKTASSRVTTVVKDTSTSSKDNAIMGLGEAQKVKQATSTKPVSSKRVTATRKSISKLTDNGYDSLALESEILNHHLNLVSRSYQQTLPARPVHLEFKPMISQTKLTS